MKMLTTATAAALFAATSYTFAAGSSSNDTYVEQIGNYNNQATIQLADPTGKNDILNNAYTLQTGNKNQSLTLQYSKNNLINTVNTIQMGIGNKSLVMQGSGHH